MSLGITKSLLHVEPSSSSSSSCLGFNLRHPRLSSKPDSPCFFNLRTHSRTRPMTVKASATAAGHHSFCATAMKESSETFYELLGIPASVSPREIKQAYKQLVLKYHPDVSPPDRVQENTQRFILLKEAYETLSDPNSRALYDVNLASGSLFAFSSGKPFRRNEDLGIERGNWRNRWESQLTELQRRSMHKDNLRDDDVRTTWGAKIRRQRNNNKATADQMD